MKSFKIRIDFKKSAVLLALLLLSMAGIASAGGGKNIELYFNGIPKSNTAQLPQAFENACAGNVCVPTTEIKAVDPVTNKYAATLHVWAKNYTFSPDNVTICFTELIEYRLSKGTIYTIGNPEGTCGVKADPSFIVPPIAQPGAYVVAGGGGGNIVGGTDKFKHLKGTYIDRVFVELSSNSVILYYSGLFFNLMPTQKTDI